MHETEHADRAAGESRSIILSTARLRVTTWLAGDLAELRALHRDPLTMRHMRSGVEDEAKTRARLEKYLSEQVERGWTKWRVQDTNASMVGRAGFNLSADQRHRELGYVLAQRLWGYGHATELALALVRWHRHHPEAGLGAALFAHVFAEHRASRRVLEKAGFTLARGYSDWADRRFAMW